MNEEETTFLATDQWFTCEVCFEPMLMSADEYEKKLGEGFFVACQSCAELPKEEAW